MKEKYTDAYPLEYYDKGAALLGPMVHKDTAKLLRNLLVMLARDGEEKTFRYIKKVLLKKKTY